MSDLKEWDNQIAITLPTSNEKSYCWIHNTGISSRPRYIKQKMFPLY